MKTIDSNTMSNIVGGTFLDGFCAGAGLSLLFFPNPLNGTITVGCTVYYLATA